MHVVYVCNEYPPTVSGGIGTAVAAQGRGMARAGHDVTVVGLYDEASLEQRDGVTVHRLRRPRTRFKLKWLTGRIAIRRFLSALHRERRIDVVEWPDYEGMFLAPIPGVTDVVRVHGPYKSHSMRRIAPRRPLMEAMEMRTLRAIPNWVGVSDWFTGEWLAITGATPARRTTIYNPVDLAVFRPGLAPRSPPRVVYVGGLKRRKGVDVAARAAKDFLARFPSARMVFMGAAADLTREDILRMAGPCADRVELVPFGGQDAVARALSGAAVYLMPSQYESFGNGWAEAMACGVPVVGSTKSCGPEVVRDGVTGFLANPDDPSDVAEKVSALLADPERAARMGAAGLVEAAERFSLDVAVRKAERFYSECVAASPERARPAALGSA